VKTANVKLAALAATYGFVAGAMAAVVLWFMNLASRLVWSGPDARWYVFAAIMTGGVIIAVLRYLYAGPDLQQQIESARRPHDGKVRNTAIVAMMAVVAVGFGGAVGPEAGILAVVAELSALITYLIARNNADESRMIGEIGAAGALGGLYGSPPGGAIIAQEHPEAPKLQLYLAGLTGLLGFLFVASRILPEGSLRIWLPEHQAAADGTDILAALLPAVMGAATGLTFLLLLPRIKAVLARLGDVRIQTIAGTVAFAALATALPILRFSGHHEMEQLLHWGQEAGPGSLIALAALKVVATALCLAAGWRGGAAFPLMFAGAAAGGVMVQLLPDIPVTVALVAGMSAALTAGMGKPMAAMLIALLLIGPVSIGPLCVGILLGWAASRLLPPQQVH
jgi:H+/Cl- antiporter ClcA